MKEAYERTHNHFSSMFTEDQVTQIVKFVMGQLYQGTDPGTIGNNLMTKFATILTPQQMSLFTTFGTTVTFAIGPTGITKFLTSLKTVCSNNLTPMMIQLQDYMTELKSNGTLTQEQILNNGLYNALTFFSVTRFTTFCCRLKRFFNNKEWSAFYPAINEIVMYNLYNDQCKTNQGSI
uniref:Uncharacterized protein n=1 Tax=Parastrongyloides trichosuri TaxID=131310 RepID=A0A0N4ZW38_PARTI